ncbi:MAG: O-antigen ligase family protein, partial [Armatimonadota bacterium]|nr:O-antigen ligase family protein [Armatimonadota bacterium]
MQELSYYAVLILVFSIPAINFDLPGSLGPVNRLLGIAAILVWLSKVVFTQQLRRPRIVHLLILLFVLLNLASYFWSMEPSDSLDRTERLMQSCVLVLMVWDVCRTRAQVNMAHLLYVLGCYVAILSTVINYLHGVKLGGEDRFAAAGFDPNDMGLILCMGIPWAWQLAISKDQSRPLLRIIGYAYPAAAVLAILLAGSRGALIAAIPGLFYVVITVRRAHPAARVALPALMVAAVLILASQRGGPLQRFTKLENSASAGNLTGRVDIWLAGVQIFEKHPLLGVG